MDSEISNLLIINLEEKCDGNICVNRREQIGFIVLENFLNIQTCEKCGNLLSLCRQVRVLTDTTHLNKLPNPFKKWWDMSSYSSNNDLIVRLLRKVLNLLDIIRINISSEWGGFEELEIGIENVIANIHLVQNCETIEETIKA